MSEQEIFVAAVDIDDPVTRAEYLDQVCGQDGALRQRIEALLEFHQRDNVFLEKPLLETRPWEAEDEEQSGAVIGRYKLIERIGEGTFGTVYMAQQLEPVHRRVALKLIKLGMDTKQVLGRFEIERQALAMMDHPNIAKVFDGGSAESGRPYFVMELVDGIPLTQFCDQVQMSLHQRLELLAAVCRAVQHAHQKGIIHRDLKPSNVLVTLRDGKPVPKIIDFGIAKATEQQLTAKTVFTRFQHFIGTPQYMSPEQATLSGLDLDTRSDVYALGVMLYELLTGTTPFEEDSIRQVALDELCRMIREEPAPPPSKRISTLGEKLKTIAKSRDTDPTGLRGVLRGELDWITSKALEKDRERRYGSAIQLAEDIERFLNHEPVLAGPPGMSYRMRKFVERKRGLVAGVMAVAATLVLGTVLSTIGFFAANRARQDEAMARQAAEDEAEHIRRLLYVSDMNAALQAWEAADLGRVVELLNRHVPRQGQADLRGFEWYLVWRHCQRGRAVPFVRHAYKT